MDKLSILAPTRYPWRFNSPRQSAHDIEIRNFVPFNKISPAIEGITIFNPFPWKKFDLVHGFNRIPLGTTPFIIGFESHLPRAFDLEDSAFFAWMSRLLASPRCRGIVAISDYACRQFMAQHKGRPWEGALAAKLSMQYPNMEIPAGEDAFSAERDEPIRLVFVGNHFARKGGTVAIRLAEMAHKNGLPLKLDIISSLQVGTDSWIGPVRAGYYERDMAQLHLLPNITLHGSLPNAQVLEMVAHAHFSLLPTFSDTFGYSTIEAMANYTPVLATAQAALPEFISDENGILLPLETNAVGEWAYSSRTDRGTPAYEALFDEQVNQLAEAAYKKIENIATSPLTYARMRKKARAKAEELFSASNANLFWDEYYRKAL